LKSIASAPAKVILFGEHFIVYGGKAILCSIDKRITVESELIDSGKIEISSQLGSISVSKDQPNKGIGSTLRPVAFIAQKMLREFNSSSGLRVSISSEIPPGVGLGSSSACCVAAAASISGLFTNYSKDDIQRLAIEAEKTIFENTSGADCSVCTFGGIIEYYRNGEINKLDVSFPLQLVIANSKISHSTRAVVSRVKKYKDNNPAIFSLLCRQEETLIDDALLALQQNNLKNIGEKMSQNQKYLDQLGVSNKTLNAMISLIRDTAYGAKLTGAGDGGCIVALVDSTNLENTISALQAENYECFATKVDTVGVDRQIKDGT
jgi:mevalonate kinase